MITTTQKRLICMEDITSIKTLFIMQDIYRYYTYISKCVSPLTYLIFLLIKISGRRYALIPRNINLIDFLLEKFCRYYIYIMLCTILSLYQIIREVVVGGVSKNLLFWPLYFSSSFASRQELFHEFLWHNRFSSHHWKHTVILEIQVPTEPDVELGGWCTNPGQSMLQSVKVLECKIQSRKIQLSPADCTSTELCCIFDCWVLCQKIQLVLCSNYVSKWILW